MITLGFEDETLPFSRFSSRVHPQKPTSSPLRLRGELQVIPCPNGTCVQRL